MAVHHLSRGILAASLLTGLAVACGSRGPLDVTIVETAPDAEVDAQTVDAVADAIGTVEAAADAADATDAPTDQNAPPDAQDASEEEGGGPGGFDAGPILSCGTCVVESCGSQLLSCVESTTCRSALECVATTCLSGGTPNIACVIGCASSDPSALGQLVDAFTCIVDTCGSQCTSVLSGLTGGGIPGSGGLGGVGGGGGG